MASIRLSHVSVSFPVYDVSSRSLKKRLLSSATGGRIMEDSEGRIPIVQALDNLNLTLDHGTKVGLVGHNGAGKTTLLRVLAGIYEPNEGTVDVEGQVAPMFDQSLGMDPESSGFENIVLRGLCLGMSKREIIARTDEIAKFTELGDFLNLPIRTFSDGMRTRLAFAISTAIQPDILLLDEGIAAGDAAFLAKANKRLEAFTEQASIIVLASHSNTLISRMCTSAILLEHGRLLAQGATDEILAIYAENKGKSKKQ